VQLDEFVRQLSGLVSKSHSERIKLFGWFLHAHGGKDRFSVSDVRTCYNTVHIELPANLNRSVEALTEKVPPDLLRDRAGYRLAHSVREQLDRTLGKSETVVVVERMLSDLPGKIADESERLFLAETLTCYRNGALRATIVMAWNLAYDHLARWVLADSARLASFNNGIAKRNPRKAHVVVSTRQDFEELKEDEAIDIAANLPGITGGIKRILKEKLGRRNTYAHPSTLRVERAQVDDMITDLVNNVVLELTM